MELVLGLVLGIIWIVVSELRKSEKRKEYLEENKREQTLHLERVRKLEDAKNLTPEEFENLVMLLFKRFGYEVNKTSYTGDGGVDLRLTKGGRKEIVQCKRYRGNVSVQQVREFFGVMVSENIQKGYIVTTGHFTFPAVQFAQGKGIHLIDGPELAEMLSNNNAHL